MKFTVKFFQVNFLRMLRFPGRVEYVWSAERKYWIVNKQLAGYAKNSRYLTEILVRNAGHKAIQDKPEFIMNLVSRLVNGTAFDDL